MDLVLSFRKKQGMMGGTSYEVQAKVRLAGQESAVLSQGGFSSMKMFETPEIAEDVTISNLVEGRTFKSKNVLAAMTFAARAKRAAAELRGYLDTAAQFEDGERILSAAELSVENG